MIKQGYEVFMHENRSVYGVEWDIRVPQNHQPVTVAQDVYGEQEERMQLFVYPSGGEELGVEDAVSIRFNNDGTIAGVVVPDGISVTGWDEPALSDWMKARDGESPKDSRKGIKQVPQEIELMKLRSVVCDLSDVLEAHAVHGDHSDAQLQEWANVGRRAVGDYKEEP